ncbi:sulfatase-like hydrolase/transferase [Solimonas marina]|uniref:Sulfatase-like hydrolase/transferase n=1 Tax=Solimonas marina TaxID=2714601 RepID=A0A969WCJ7_9GAMM|nr:sulfatase-like hydrolase/transferase [Solimonas marina]
MTVSRRAVIGGIGALTLAGAAGIWAHRRRGNQPRLKLPPNAGAKPYNILLISSDEEQTWSLLPADLIERYCPGRARIRQEALSFTRAFTPTPICSTARGCLYSGQHSQNNGLWENIPLPYAPPMKRTAPTLGTLMSAAGYRTGYFGKWHLSHLATKDHQPWPADQVHEEIVSYGFDETGTDREHDGMLNGHRDDPDTGDKAVAFVKSRADDAQPWFAAVNLVNPHDIMFYTSGPAMTATRKITYPDALSRPPETPLYEQRLGYPLPANFGPGTLSGSVPAATEFAKCTDIALGAFPYDDAAACDDFVNYYYNCIRESDEQIVRLLDALDASGQADNTIVIFTSDHGEMLGVHGLRTKGVLPYREAVQVPLLVRHPQYRQSRDTATLVSHIDIAPTLLGLAGVPAATVAREVPELIGRDLTQVITEPGAAGPRDGGDGLLLHWTSLAYQDHVAALGFDAERKNGGGGNPLALLKPQFRGVIKKRGQMRGVFDGRYKFSRFFAPTEHNTPQSWEQLMALNDIELYDTQTDPGENHNLARDPAAVRDLVMRMNAKLNRLIASEIGIDDGRYMPGPSAIWRA